MTNAKPGRSFRSLAEEAGPVRGWLKRYFGRRARNPADVDDMVQDVFARIVARDTTQPIEHLGGYVLNTASSVLADWGRRRSARSSDAHVAFEPERHGEEDLDPERILTGKQDLNAAITVLLTLPERTRTVFILRRLEGESFRDIASRLGISVSAVEKHMMRAIQTLSSGLDDHHGS